MSYWSLGGRRAADTVERARKTAADASSTHARSRAILGVIGSIIAFTTQLLADEAEARKSPVLRSLIDGIGVGPTLEPGEELHSTGAAAETHARFEAAAPLHGAAGDRRIDPDQP